MTGRPPAWAKASAHAWSGPTLFPPEEVGEWRTLLCKPARMPYDTRSAFLRALDELDRLNAELMKLRGPVIPPRRGLQIRGDDGSVTVAGRRVVTQK